MRVLTVLGARPQFVKSLPVSAALAPDHEEMLVHTGQHYDEELSDVFFEELGLSEPAYDLGVGSAPHAIQTAEMMRGLDPIVAEEAPDVVLVYGDTNSTLAGALVGAKRDTTVVHVEAGLRSGNRAMPEEHNRVVTDHVADLLFAPSEDAERHLATEGLDGRSYRPGDVMYDALLWARDVAASESTVLEELGLTAGEFVLATVHRPRNTDDPARLEAIFEAFGEIDPEVVVPLHPRTADRLRAQDSWETADDAVTLVDPVGYLDFVRLLSGAERVATDSGGVQKEAFFLDTPCVTLREETEWVETVDAGWNVLVGADPAEIEWGLTAFAPPTERPDPYGSGDAAERIAEVLSNV
jgi:UDP-N-acetylglucosamine 2-epimerase (non-hydrolysing)